MGKRQRGNQRLAGRSNQVRIIGGIHRGRKLTFPTLLGLRPTSDRVRETLFNWLQVPLPGAVCLDLFAGSGALGVEASSRGAGWVVMLDRSEQVVQVLRQHIALLGLTQTEVVQADAVQWLQRDPTPFDLVFLDPPFAEDLLPECCQLLEFGGWLRAGARIYMEFDKGCQPRDLPGNWRLLRRKLAGQVCYHLYLRDD